LIYKFRCKIAHERNLIGGIATIEENNYKYPIYIDFSGYWDNLVGTAFRFTV